MIDALIITTNALVVISSIALAFVTFADVNKEEQKTIREVVKETLRPQQHHTESTEPKRGTGDADHVA